MQQIMRTGQKRGWSGLYKRREKRRHIFSKCSFTLQQDMMHQLNDRPVSLDKASLNQIRDRVGSFNLETLELCSQKIENLDQKLRSSIEEHIQIRKRDYC